MSISADSPSDKTLNRGPLALLLRRQYEFSFGINTVQFSIFKFPFSPSLLRCVLFFCVEQDDLVVKTRTFRSEVLSIDTQQLLIMVFLRLLNNVMFTLVTLYSMCIPVFWTR